MKSVLLIDGENLKGKVKDICDELKRPKPDWGTFNFDGLFERVLDGVSIDEKIFYFAHVREHPQTKEKSKVLIEEQRLLKNNLEKQNFKPVFAGNVRGFPNHKGGGITFKEKGVDVRIAVDLVVWACDKKVKEVFLCSSDSDLQPAIKELTRRGVRITYIGFENKPNKGMTFTTDKTILIRDSEVFEFETIKKLF